MPLQPSSLMGLAKARLRKLKESQAESAVIDCPDPVEFCVKYLGFHPWTRQAEFLRAIADHPKVAVRSGHKVGKSTGAAALGLWWLYTHSRGKVIMTSPGHRQISEILWPEVIRLHRNARVPLAGIPSANPNGGLTLPDGRRLFGFATNETEKMGGFSGENLLFIVDEASGVEKMIFDAIEGNRAGGAREFLIGNPTKTSGVFFDAFTKDREEWKLVHVSSEESPNVTGIGTPVPGLATREWVDEKARSWGEENPLYQIRVRGNFPSQAENAVMGLALIEAAAKGWRPPVFDDGPLELGVDPARFGVDETVIVARRGLYADMPIALRSMNGPDVAGKVMEVVRAHMAVDAKGAPIEKPRVKVDVIGIGASVFDFLAQQKTIEAVPVNVGKSADDDLHALLRDRLWFNCAEWLKEGGKLPPHDGLMAQLIAPTYSFTLTGKRKVQGKDEMKKAGGRSPDHADALNLAVFHAPVWIVDNRSEHDSPDTDAYKDQEQPLVTNLQGFV